ncbi:hypothetical protein ACPCHT_37790 [Nucisporomicrobium flavum]|uniref:hypothetical protein n=1 Tax=Nucisporomicrobium flavum TaxID=2785915 RepID=UPI003C2CFE37
MREPEEDLRVLLREEAERHRPDRDAMFDRIVRVRAESRRSTLVRLRPLAAAAAVGLVVVGVVGVRVAGGGEGEGDSAPVPAAAPSLAPAEPSPKPSHPPARPATSAPPKASVSSKAVHRPGFVTGAAVIDPHSNPNWSQGNLTLRLARKVTALAVTVSVARTAGVASTGQWSTVPNQLTTLSVTERPDRLVYRFELVEGATLEPGHYTFAVQYNHADGRSPAADTYVVTATGGGDQTRTAGAF